MVARGQITGDPASNQPSRWQPSMEAWEGRRDNWSRGAADVWTTGFESSLAQLPAL